MPLGLVIQDLVVSEIGVPSGGPYYKGILPIIYYVESILGVLYVRQTPISRDSLIGLPISAGGWLRVNVGFSRTGSRLDFLGFRV